MIYKVYVKGGIPKSAETIDTNTDSGSVCATWKEYMGYMSDILAVGPGPIVHATLKSGQGIYYYIESETLAGAVSKVDRVLLADRLRG